MDDDDWLTKLGFYLCNHLIGLAIWYQLIDADGNPINDVQFTCYSASIISINGLWNILTAGHILENIEDSLKSKKINIYKCQLLDYLGTYSKSREPIPFDYLNSSKTYFVDFDNGLDFGLIKLSNMYRELLSSNGVIPLDEKRLLGEEILSTDNEYLLLGIPQKFTFQEEKGFGKSNSQLIGTISPTIIEVKKILNYEEKSFSSSPFFVGKLEDNEKSFDDISGMSGGPIFGFNEDLKRYWIIGIQSNWLKNSKIIFSCKTTTIYQHIIS